MVKVLDVALHQVRTAASGADQLDPMTLNGCHARDLNITNKAQHMTTHLI